jgi:hypothetical protein
LFAGDCYMNAPPLHLALLRGPSDFVPLCERILKSELTTALDIASWGSRYLPLHTAIVAGAPAAVLERLVRAYDAATQWEHEEYDRRGTPASQRPPREPAWAFETGGLDALELALVALAPVGSVEYVLGVRAQPRARRPRSRQRQRQQLGHSSQTAQPQFHRAGLLCTTLARARRPLRRLRR